MSVLRLKALFRNGIEQNQETQRHANGNANAELDVSGRGLGDPGAIVVARGFRLGTVLLKALTALNLEDNDIGVEGAEAIAASLKHSLRLTSLNMTANRIADGGATALANAVLREDLPLRTLSLHGNIIGEVGAIAIFERLELSLVLETLDMGSNLLRTNGAEAVVDALWRQAHATHRSTRGPAVSLGPKGTGTLEAGCTAGLTVLNLGFCYLGNEGAVILSKALPLNSTLSELRIYSNDIGYDGAKALCESLRPPPHGNSNIHVLDLYNNGKIGERGAKEVAEMLRTNVSITSLDLSGCNIGQGGGAAIGLALSESNRTLTRLDVSGNKVEGAIGEVGARSLAAALATNEILRYLDVEGNAIGDNGGLAFLDAVQNNSTLLGLGWRDKNRISAEVATSLEQALEEANHTCFARY